MSKTATATLIGFSIKPWIRFMAVSQTQDVGRIEGDAATSHMYYGPGEVG